jgi:3',5'-cyclic AMP phosphodiesterase CpdA
MTPSLTSKIQLFITTLLSALAVHAESFTFVQMCDTQLGMGGYEHDVRAFELAVKKINALQPDFVVICGDLVSKPDQKSFTDFKRIRSGFAIPCHCAAGNHDIGNKPSAKSLDTYRKTIGNDYYSFEHKGRMFIVVNTGLWKAPLEVETEKHDEWLRKTLDQAQLNQQPVFIVGHYPLYVKTSDEEENYYNLPPDKRSKLLALFKEKGVEAYLAGHTHTSIFNNYEGIQLVNGETTSRNFDQRPLGFRLWHVSTTKTTHEFIPLEAPNK